MQAYYPQGRPLRNTRHAFASVFREGSAGKVGTFDSITGGLRSLYRGVEATTLRGIVLSTSQICSYDHIKQMLKRGEVMQEGLGLHLTASLFAG